jgi:hypothetical protein
MRARIFAMFSSGWYSVVELRSNEGGRPLAMHGVVQAGIPDSLGGFRKVSFFYLQKFNIGGKSMSLYHFENEVIRPLGEERVHFALNCMVIGCPKLPRSAFSLASKRCLRPVEVRGSPPRTFRQWAQAHADAFRWDA